MRGILLKKIETIILGAIICLIIVGISVVIFTNDSPHTGDENKETDIVDTNQTIVLDIVTSYTETINGFGFNLLKQFNKDYNSDNYFFSPYSIFTALAMTYEGARTGTADGMGQVLKIAQDNETFHNYVKGLYGSLNHNEKYNISTANALWIKNNFKLLDAYIDVIQQFYGGETSNVDFSNPQESASIINQWVENKTNNLIKNLISASVIDPIYCRLILTNAIYFKGTWKVQFDEINTTGREFILPSDEIINVSTMKLIDTQDRFNYTETEGFQLLELPYDGDDLSMIILLPKDHTNVTSIVESLDEGLYNQWINTMHDEEADIYLPKFKIETPLYKLKDYLSDLGMGLAFSDNADFSGITEEEPLKISDVLHKAFIEVNEEGTEAAAATAVIMATTSIDGGNPPPRIVFNCDHPFIFFIQHKETGTILFSGVMNNPTT